MSKLIVLVILSNQSIDIYEISMNQMIVSQLSDFQFQKLFLDFKFLCEFFPEWDLQKAFQ